MPFLIFGPRSLHYLWELNVRGQWARSLLWWGQCPNNLKLVVSLSSSKRGYKQTSQWSSLSPGIFGPRSLHYFWELNARGQWARSLLWWGQCPNNFKLVVSLSSSKRGYKQRSQWSSLSPGIIGPRSPCYFWELNPPGQWARLGHFFGAGKVPVTSN